MINEENTENPPYILWKDSLIEHQANRLFLVCSCIFLAVGDISLNFIIFVLSPAVGGWWGDSNAMLYGYLSYGSHMVWLQFVSSKHRILNRKIDEHLLNYKIEL